MFETSGCYESLLLPENDSPSPQVHKELATKTKKNSPSLSCWGIWISAKKYTSWYFYAKYKITQIHYSHDYRSIGARF
jgi:hypothetical protein